MDRFFKGLISGMVSGLCIDLWGFLFKDLLKIATRNYVDWTAALIFGSLPQSWYGFFLAFVTHLLWTGFLGILLACLLARLSPQGTWIKGEIIGFIIGFFVSAIATLLRMPFFAEITFTNALTFAVGGPLWGIITVKMRKRAQIACFRGFGFIVSLFMVK